MAAVNITGRLVDDVPTTRVELEFGGCGRAIVVEALEARESWVADYENPHARYRISTALAAIECGATELSPPLATILGDACAWYASYADQPEADRAADAARQLRGILQDSVDLDGRQEVSA